MKKKELDRDVGVQCLLVVEERGGSSSKGGFLVDVHQSGDVGNAEFCSC